MSDLRPEKRLDKNGVLTTKHVKAQAAQPVRKSAFPPVGVQSASSGDVFRAFGKVFKNPEEIEWDRLSNDDVTKIANHASNELEKNKKNANAMFDFYAEMFRNENVDTQHAKHLMDENDVLRKVKGAFVEANGLDADEWTPEQFSAREEYIMHLTAFNEAFDASGVREEPEPVSH